MKNPIKAASLAAIFVTLLSAGSFTDAGFAFGLTTSSTVLEADTIVVDQAVLAADEQSNALAKSDKVVASINDQGDIIFTPGTGRAQDIAQIEPEPTDASEKSYTKPVKAAAMSASSLAALVNAQDVGGTLGSEAQCLAGAVYFESKGESLAGQLAVARVVMARSKSGRFPSSLCGVVYQRSQFSFVRGNSMPRIDTGSQNWRNAVAISKIAMTSSWKSPVEGALFFHSRHVSPGWKLTRIGSVDNHVFYR